MCLFVVYLPVMEKIKQVIFKNVGALYLKFGIRSVTMDDVASEFGISKKTLYQYFSDKKELVSEVIDFYLENPAFDFSKQKYANAIDGMFDIRAHVVKLFQFFNNNVEYDLKKLYPDLYKKIYEAKRKRILDNTITNITQGIEQGMYRQELDAVLMAKLQVGRMLLIFNPDHKVFEENEIVSIEVFDKVMDYHMHGVCTPEGIDYYKKQLNKIKNDEKN